jgi:hypothetical protein
MRRLISPISSRNTVPRSALSKVPALSRYAPVKLPRTWPNSSDSRSVSGRPAQFTGTKDRLARALRQWIAWATSSLPTPLSPVMRILASESAMRSISCLSSIIGRLFPISWA